MDYTTQAKQLLAQMGFSEQDPDYWQHVRALNGALQKAHQEGRTAQGQEIAKMLHGAGIIELPTCDDCGEILPTHKWYCERARVTS